VCNGDPKTEFPSKSRLLYNSMEHCPSLEAISHSASQVIPNLLWNLNVHYCVHKSQPVTGAYPQPDASTPHLSTLIPKEPF
jgi:hypothetical protein